MEPPFWNHRFHFTGGVVWSGIWHEMASLPSAKYIQAALNK
ncbi:hypothetical protein SAMN05421736_106163 [Evansella caseinilytica]|uniref:Uncharacterized protein n=1 Tax=Evansella caseinilytica TaxID=1503961 RepID=A0A1H3QH38_9BACI|nr:hypothetical protein SAMN05421736_106163 [Evansella caseinilytica]